MQETPIRPSSFLRLNLSRTLCLTALTVAILPAEAGDWPRWHGPNVDAISTEQGWSVAAIKDGVKTLWQAEVGVGYSSMSVAKGRVYTMGNQDEQDSILCFAAETGKLEWKHTYACSPKDPNGYPGPRCTPTVEGGRVYSVSRRGHFFSLDAATGKVVWSKEFPKDYGAPVPQWGFAGSPLVEGNWVIAEVGGAGSSVVAFDKATGKEAWRAGDDTIGYSSIVPFDQKGERTLAVLSAKGIVGRKAKDGTEVWRFPWKTSYDVNAATPIVADGTVFISSGYGTGCARVRFDTGEPKVLWQHKKMRNHVATCVLWKGYLYGFDESKLKCLDFQTGEEKWSEDSYGKGSVFIADGKLILYSDKGRVGVAEPNPESFKELASAQVLEGKDTWAVPVLANGRLYCRNLDHLVCLDVK
jgi:outer membrane protein assembly factor BamB